MTSRTIAVVSAGLRQPSSTRLLADRLAQATRDELQLLGVEAETPVVELREHGHEVVNHLLTGFAPEGLRSALDLVSGADGLIAVTPVFNASYAGLFKAFFDVVEDTALTDTPVLAAATGGTGRHSLVLEHALRPMFSYLHATVVPTAVYAATEDWAGEGDAGLLHRIQRAAGELAREVARREPKRAEDPFELTTSFERLLAAED